MEGQKNERAKSPSYNSGLGFRIVYRSGLSFASVVRSLGQDKAAMAHAFARLYGLRLVWVDNPSGRCNWSVFYERERRSFIWDWGQWSQKEIMDNPLRARSSNIRVGCAGWSLPKSCLTLPTKVALGSNGPDKRPRIQG